MTQKTYGDMTKAELLAHFNERADKAGIKLRRRFETRADAMKAILQLPPQEEVRAESRRRSRTSVAPTPVLGSADLRLRSGSDRQRIVELCDGTLTRAQIAEKLGAPKTGKDVGVVLNCMRRDYGTKIETDESGRVKITALRS